MGYGKVAAAGQRGTDARDVSNSPVHALSGLCEQTSRVTANLAASVSHFPIFVFAINIFELAFPLLFVIS